MQYNGGVFLLRQSDLTDLARRVCRSFIRPSVSFLVGALGFSSEFSAGQRESCYAGVFKFLAPKR